MSEPYDLVIVGMGSAGVVAAEFAATLPIRVAAVERDRVGGDCLWTGCVPSKAFLASAKAAHTMRHADRFGLETVGLAAGAGGALPVDGRSRTQHSWLYAVGDVTGGHQFTHAAAAEAAAAVRDMFFPGRGRPPALIPWATFTDPELARVGLTSGEAIERHGPDAVEVHTMELARSDRARAERNDDGLLVVVTRDDEILGAHVLAPHAGEMIGELTLAMEQGVKLSALANVVHVYPTYATSIAQLAAESAYERAERYHWLVRA